MSNIAKLFSKVFYYWIEHRAILHEFLSTNVIKTAAKV